MRFAISSLALLFVLAGPVRAQISPDSLTPTQQSAYADARLYLETRSFTAINGAGQVIGPATTKWDAFQGGHPLSEVEFYERIGADELADDARARRASARRLMIIGGLVGAAGLTYVAAEMWTGLANTGNGYEDRTNYDAVVLVGCAAGIATYLFGSASTRLHQRSTSQEHATTLADAYNEALLERLLQTDPP